MHNKHCLETIRLNNRERLLQVSYKCFAYTRTDFMPNGRETKAVPGKGCPRCGFCVFEAEKLIAAGRVNTF